MSIITEFMIQKGVNEMVLALLLTIPIITVIVSIARHFIGIKSFGVFTPVLLSVAYSCISDNWKVGLVYGLAITLGVFLASFVYQYLLDSTKNKLFRLHYLPKLGLAISLVCVTFFGFILLAATLDKSFTKIDPLALLTIITLGESFMMKSFKKGFDTAIGITMETVFLALIGYALIMLKPLQAFLLNHPEVVLLSLPLNLLIGKFTGLRLRELFRFSDISEE